MTTLQLVSEKSVTKDLVFEAWPLSGKQQLKWLFLVFE